MALVLKAYPNLVETFIAQEIQLLEQAGFNIVIYSMRKPKDKQRQPIIDAIHADTVYLPDQLRKAPLSILLENAKALARFPRHYPLAALRALGRSLRRLSKEPLKRFLQAGWLVGDQNLGGTDVAHLHSHFVHVPTEMSMFASMISGLTYSISAHARDIYTIPERDVILRINRSEFLVTCTRYNYDYLRQIDRVDASKVHCIYHGIDVNAFAPTDAEIASAGRPLRLITIGRLVEKKGYPYILQALRTLLDEGMELEYDVYGEGELRPDIEAEIQRLALSEIVTLHGYATHPQLIERMKSKGIYVNGSVLGHDGDRDGIPNTLAEAMAMGLPAIATRISGIPELIEHGRSGLLVEPNNPIALADAIRRVASDSQLQQQLAVNGRKRVEEIFQNTRCIAECERLLRSCLT